MTARGSFPNAVGVCAPVAARRKAWERIGVCVRARTHDRASANRKQINCTAQPLSTGLTAPPREHDLKKKTTEKERQHRRGWTFSFFLLFA